MSHRIAANPTAPATRRQLHSLRRLMAHHNRRRAAGQKITLARLAQRAKVSAGWLSEITQEDPVLPGGRIVTKGEYQRLRALILELAGK